MRALLICKSGYLKIMHCMVVANEINKDQVMSSKACRVTDIFVRDQLSYNYNLMSVYQVPSAFTLKWL